MISKTLSRVVTAVVLVALAITLGAWLTHPPVTAAPLVKESPASVPAAEPTLAPPETAPATVGQVIEVQVEAVVAPTTAKPIYYSRRRGLFRRR